MKHSRLQWRDITVEQFLNIYRLSMKPELDDITSSARAICILFNKTEREVDDMTMAEFKLLAGQVAFVLTEAIPGKARRVIRANGNRYRITYQPNKLRHRQYVEILHFGDKPIDNMHLIMASIVQPITWYGKVLRNKADDHEKIAADMLQARVVDVYHSSVFFCKLYVNLISNIRDYLAIQMVKMNQAVTREEAMEQIDLLIKCMVGFIPQKNFQILKVSA